MDLSSESHNNVTVVQQIPVEIWRSILLIAVESPVLPRPGDDVLDGLILFSWECQFRNFVLEAMRERLRLVCRTWNAILENEGVYFGLLHGNTLQQVSFAHKKRQKIRRIESNFFWARPSPDLERRLEESSEDREKFLRSSNMEDVKYVEFLHISTNYNLTNQCELAMDILSRATRIRAVEIHTIYMTPGALNNILDHSAFDRITHFSIIMIGNHGWQVGRISFPAVQCLRICTRALSLSQEKYIDNWEFPSLTSLMLHRNYETGESVFDGLGEFVAAHGKKVTSLNIEFTFPGELVSLWYPIDDIFWGQFPNLRLLAPGLGALGNGLVPPPPEVKLTSLGIPGMLPLWKNYTPACFDGCIHPLLRACRTLRVKQLVLLSSWDAMASKFGAPTPGGFCRSGWSKRLFEDAAVDGIEVVDIDRVPVADPQGVRFLEKLRGPNPV